MAAFLKAKEIHKKAGRNVKKATHFLPEDEILPDGFDNVLGKNVILLLGLNE